MASSIDLIIFDCDGTLVDSEAIGVQVFTNYWATFGVHVTPDEFKETYIGTAKDAEVNVRTFAEMPPQAWDDGNALFESALERELQAVQGMHDLLRKLKSKMSVASNSSLNYVRKVLRQTQIDHFFADRVFSAELVSRPKPHPDLFLHVAETQGIKPAKCVVVEDSATGILAAQGAQIPVIGFSGGAHFNPSLEHRLRSLNPDWFCSNISELEDILMRFEKSE